MPRFYLIDSFFSCLPQTDPALIVIILFQVYLAYSLLYKNLNPQPEAILVNKIVKIDLKAYKDTTDLIQARTDFAAFPHDLNNPNPFTYNE